MSSSASPDSGATRGAIHDLGYRPYTGPRRPYASRYLVVARNVVQMAWRLRFGVKAPIFGSALVVLGASIVMWVMGHRLTNLVRAQGAPLPHADAIVFSALPFLQLFGFVLATVVGCAAVADDLKVGAFQFYFSRPLRARDYVLGKLAGACFVIGIPLFCGPVLLSLLRLLYAESFGDALRLLPIVPRAIALGTAATLGYALPAVAAGAILPHRRAAQALFAVYFIVLAPMFEGFARHLGVPQILLLSLADDVSTVGRALFGLDARQDAPPAWQSAVALAGAATAAFALVHARVRRAEMATLERT